MRGPPRRLTYVFTLTCPLGEGPVAAPASTPVRAARYGRSLVVLFVRVALLLVREANVAPYLSWPLPRGRQ